MSGLGRFGCVLLGYFLVVRILIERLGGSLIWFYLKINIRVLIYFFFLMKRYIFLVEIF